MQSVFPKYVLLDINIAALISNVYTNQSRISYVLYIGVFHKKGLN